MVERRDLAEVHLWGQRVGAVAWDRGRSLGSFQFDPAFTAVGLDVAPLMMPVGDGGQVVHAFPALSRETFHGLPGMLADCLPDQYGNRLVDAWLARRGREPGSFSPVERLCYTGARGMGALEFVPPQREGLDQSVEVDVGALVCLARAIMEHRSTLHADLNDEDQALRDILRVGTSAGGARAKAILAIDGKTGKVRSGQVRAPKGYTYWILKFDGITDHVLGTSESHGRIEYAYYRMALAAGITMSECRLHQEGGRAHFMTRRFDRTPGGDKLHLQSLTGIAHFDFNMAGGYAYEQAFQVMRRLRLPYPEAEEQFRRMVFNVVARNQDDHPKNIGFLMNRRGRWRLSPAYDVTYAHNPDGEWTSQHQMTINGKRKGFTRQDLHAVAQSMSIKHPDEIVEEVLGAVSSWPEFAAAAGVPAARIDDVRSKHRMEI